MPDVSLANEPHFLSLHTQEGAKYRYSDGNRVRPPLRREIIPAGTFWQNKGFVRFPLSGLLFMHEAGVIPCFRVFSSKNIELWYNSAKIHLDGR